MKNDTPAMTGGVAIPVAPSAAEEAEAVSARAGPEKTSHADDGPPPSDDEPPNWPDESVEASFLAEARAQGVSVAASAETETKVAPLPPLDELVQRVPAELREALDELFRARFVTVKRVPEKALK